MTNTTQTDLLDGVEPDCWRYSSADGIYRYRGPCANFDKDYNALKPVALYSRETVEALLEANRKQVLLEAAKFCESKADAHGWNYHLPSVGREIGAELGRMAESDKGGNDE